MTRRAFAKPADNPNLEEGSGFTPRFDANGLLPVMAISAANQIPLMFAYMNEQALHLTIETGEAHYFSRSRNKLWKKGETSGQTQKISRILTDCDQDVLILEVEVAGEGAACHTGRATCFYRAVQPDGSLKTVDQVKLIDPDKVYAKPES